METGIGLRYRLVRVTESGKFPAVSTQALSLACNHCDNAWCRKVCPTGAIWRRDDGIVLIDRELCIGCQQCEKFCPYQVPKLNNLTRKMEKCTMCADRVDEGLQPACATLCPTEALKWGKWDDIRDKGVAQVANFTDPKLTVPAIRFVNTAWGK